MAKKKPSGDGFNMSAAIREALSTNSELSGREAREIVQQAHPEQTINTNSFSVAFSKARQEMGIKGGRRKVVRRRKPGTPRKQAESASGLSVTIDDLLAARKLLEAAGDAETAVRAIRQLQSLQIG